MGWGGDVVGMWWGSEGGRLRSHKGCEMFQTHWRKGAHIYHCFFLLALLIGGTINVVTVMLLIRGSILEVTGYRNAPPPI